ncbi:COQ9 family protein [Roseovarius sp. EL26]|uniref:COQ9 family protein n=1 Tax=Roseovarius sp. EL26 TaxID=2126672 RepID=UPI000EA035A8|nr:COQ9 family protein [Roseovarius sp. EL26]
MTIESDLKAQFLAAAISHVPFDGWSTATFEAACGDIELDLNEARGMYPRGAVELALAYHDAGDLTMLARLEKEDLSEMRFRDRIAAAVQYRLEVVEDKELVRRGMTLFSLPQYAGDGAQALWRTCDRIWTALGDTSDDINWYSKRATLSGVYGAVVLYWLGDESDDHVKTWEFLDRRIDDVMQIEKLKAKARESKLISSVLAGPLAILGKVKAPTTEHQAGMPGRWNGPS